MITRAWTTEITLWINFLILELLNFDVFAVFPDLESPAISTKTDASCSGVMFFLADGRTTALPLPWKFINLWSIQSERPSSSYLPVDPKSDFVGWVLFDAFLTRCIDPSASHTISYSQSSSSFSLDVVKKLLPNPLMISM